MTKGNEWIDLRSDTVTRPTLPMLEYMFNAECGDDVFGEDPSVNALEKKSAEIFGMEAALFVPSGTMANQIAIRLHTRSQDEVMCDRLSHIYYYEAGGMFSNSGVSVRFLDGDRGRISAEQILQNINDRNNIHLPLSTLVSIENTCNKGGGSFYKVDEVHKISYVCREHHLKLHMDGARIFNALTESRESPQQYGMICDSISFCLSKGLGAPVGSVLLSSEENIQKARRIRKGFGGGMRQAGFMAAAGIFALDNHIDRLEQDHENAKKIGKTLANQTWVSEVLPVETNIVVFRLADQINTDLLLNYLVKKNIKAVPFGNQTIRMVTHLDISNDMIENVIIALNNFD
ncbi:MAG: threonine aldolase [Bacteroidetes bacterium]|nr:MAG: threonine aldolase [Bacteroidota bacterium]